MEIDDLKNKRILSAGGLAEVKSIEFSSTRPRSDNSGQGFWDVEKIAVKIVSVASNSVRKIHFLNACDIPTHFNNR